MKKLSLVLLSCTSLAISAFSQSQKTSSQSQPVSISPNQTAPVKRIENLKDAWGLTYSYTGEVKDGKPNGWGVAKYASGNVLRYVGNFINGMYNGKGTMFFEKGDFLTGTWKNGKLNGKGTNFNSDGSLYIGDFADGEKNGQGLLIFKDNGFVKGNYKNDKMEGRCINVWTDGNIVSDIFYHEDKRNGNGFQYEAKTKKLYEGEWSNDQWTQAASAGFSSFLTAPNFTGEMTADHVLMGPVNSSKYLVDTSYFYDLKEHKRYFGYYENGHLRNGVIIRDDSSRFYGPLNTKGASGYCYDFKFGKYYSEGNYTDDFLTGNILDLNLEKKSAYYGNAVNGVFTGKAYFFNENGTMYSGDYLNGRFTGEGYRLETSGKYVSGTWQDGKLKKLNSIVTAKGDIIKGNLQTLSDAINAIAKDYPGTYFDDLVADVSDDYDLIDELDTSGTLDFSTSVFSIPGSTDDNLIATDYDQTDWYYASFLETDDGAKAKAKYNELAQQLLSITLSNSYLAAKTKLQGAVVQPDLDNDKTETVFSIPGNKDSFADFHIWLTLKKNEDDNYVVSITIGSKGEDE